MCRCGLNVPISSDNSIYKIIKVIRIILTVKDIAVIRSIAATDLLYIYKPSSFRVFFLYCLTSS